MKIKNITLLILICSTFSISKTIHYKLDASTNTGQRIIKQELKFRNSIEKTVVQEIKRNREDINRLNEAVSILIDKDIKKSSKTKKAKKTKKKEKIKKGDN